MIKKTNERYKERKIIENITINLPSQNPIAKIQYNNLKHNTSLINGSQTTIFAGTVYTYIRTVSSGEWFGTFFLDWSQSRVGQSEFFFEIKLPLVTV